MNQELLQKIHNKIKEKGEIWVIAAMVEGSIGYYSPHIAAVTLGKILKDGKSFSERGMCCYGCDGLAEVDHDINWFEHLEQREPATVSRMVEFARNTVNIDGFAFNAGLSAAYPTNPP